MQARGYRRLPPLSFFSSLFFCATANLRRRRRGSSASVSRRGCRARTLLNGPATRVRACATKHRARTINVRSRAAVTVNQDVEYSPLPLASLLGLAHLSRITRSLKITPRRLFITYAEKKIVSTTANRDSLKLHLPLSLRNSLLLQDTSTW